MVETATFIEVARVLRPWGREGAVVVRVLTDRPDSRFAAGETLELRQGETTRTGTVAWWRWRRESAGSAVLKFEELDGIEAAERLRDARVGLDRSELDARFGARTLLDDLRGLAVVDTDGRSVGRVKDVEEGGPQTLLVIETSEGERLVPLHPNLCPEIDVEAGRVVVRALPGLLDGEGAEA